MIELQMKGLVTEMKKNYVTPTNEIILLDAEIRTVLEVSTQANWENVDGVNYDQLIFH